MENDGGHAVAAAVAVASVAVVVGVGCGVRSPTRDLRCALTSSRGCCRRFPSLDPQRARSFGMKSPTGISALVRVLSRPQLQLLLHELPVSLHGPRLLLLLPEKANLIVQINSPYTHVALCKFWLKLEFHAIPFDSNHF